MPCNKEKLKTILILKDKYRIKTFKEPKKALDYIIQNEEEINLVLLDIMMPECDYITKPISADCTQTLEHKQKLIERMF